MPTKLRDQTLVYRLRVLCRDWRLYTLIAIPFVYFVVFKYGPMVGNLIAFRKYVPGGPWTGTTWVGLKYFDMFINDPNFWAIFGNTLQISLASLVFGFPFPIIFALLLNEIRFQAFKRTVQTISYLPHFLSIVVVAALIKEVLSPSGGIVNLVITALGGQPVAFFQESQYFVWIYVISGIWQGMGWGAILYLAALTSINSELYEAAAIDGAGRWKQTLHVTLPGMLPTVVILLILNVGNILNVGFEKVMLLYNPAIYDRADVLSTYLYRMAMEMNSFSYATAIGLFESVLGVILVVAANRFARKFADASLW